MLKIFLLILITCILIYLNFTNRKKLYTYIACHNINFTLYFQVLIILKENLTIFHSSFEALMKSLMPEIVVDLIPESCFLEQETDIFRFKIASNIFFNINRINVIISLSWYFLYYSLFKIII